VDFIQKTKTVDIPF